MKIFIFSDVMPCGLEGK